MDAAYISLISGFAGAIIGAASSVIVMVMQSRAENRRHLREMALKLATEERQAMVKAAEGNTGPNTIAVYPIELFYAFNLRVLKALDSKKFDKAAVEDAHADMVTYKQHLDEREAQRKAASL